MQKFKTQQQASFQLHYLLSINTVAILLVQRLGVGGGGGNVSVTGSLVGAGGLLQRGGGGEVGATSGVVGSGVVTDEVEGVGESGEHSANAACASTSMEAAFFNSATPRHAAARG